MSIPTTISAYLRAYGNELGEKVLTQFPPLHSPDDPIWPALKQLKRKPFPAQTLAILGIVKRWEEARAAAAVAECGTGKTLVSLGSVFTHARGRSFTALAMCPPPYAPGHPRIEQVRYSWEQLVRDTGVTSQDVGMRVSDYGAHYWTSRHPYIVPSPFTLEPTESYTQRELDEYADILGHVVEEAYSQPEIVKTAPHNSSIHRVQQQVLQDPAQWAMTWRAYRRKVEAAKRAGSEESNAEAQPRPQRH